MPLDALQRALGHSNMDTVMIYNQVRDGPVVPGLPGSDGRAGGSQASTANNGTKTDRDHWRIGETAETHRAGRRVLSQERYSSANRAKIPHLYAPYEDAFLRYVARGPMNGDPPNHLCRSFRLCAQMMLDLGRTYWGFTWEPLLAWRHEHEYANDNHSPVLGN